MRHLNAGRKFGRSTSHRKALFNNLVCSLLEHERIETTDAKAKELKRLVDRMITVGKKGTLGARRLAAASIPKPQVVQKLFAELAPRFANRPGGYSRIMKLGRRQGDGAPMSIIELIPADEPLVFRARKQAVGTTQPVETKETFAE